jgi:hypothetical protein
MGLPPAQQAAGVDLDALYVLADDPVGLEPPVMAYTRPPTYSCRWSLLWSCAR